MTDELPHIRCIECGKVIGHKWEPYQKLLSEGVPIKTAMEKLGIDRYCCRYRMMNPIKIPRRSQAIVNKNMEIKPAETLTMAIGNAGAPTVEPLQAMQEVPALGYTVVLTQPNQDMVPGIALPDIPQIDIPTIPTAGTEANAAQGNIIRTYQAW